MATAIRESKTQHLQAIVNAFAKATGATRIDMREVASWAIRNGMWQPSRKDAIKQCAHELARAARDEFYVDPQNRHVRKKHALRIQMLEDDGEKQLSLWVDITTSSREDMQMSFQQRRQYIVGDCRQLRTDLESFNENYNRGAPIQLSFDFTEDLEEAAMATEYPVERPEGE